MNTLDRSNSAQRRALHQMGTIPMQRAVPSPVPAKPMRSPLLWIGVLILIGGGLLSGLVMLGAASVVIVRAAGPLLASATPLPTSTPDPVQQYVSAAFTIQLYNPVTNTTDTWSVPGEQWRAWVSMHSPAGPTFDLNSAPLTNYLNGQNLKLGEGHYIDVKEGIAAVQEAVAKRSTTATVRLHNAPTPYTVLPGEMLGTIAFKQGIPMWRIMRANPGVNLNALSTGQRLTMPSKDDLLPLPIVPNKRIVVSIGKQHMWVYENGQVKWDWVASTGISSSPTMPGVFQVQGHEKNAYGALWNLWMPHFLSIYEAVPGFTNGIHGLPTLSGGSLLWAGYLGRPITYGCVLLSLENAAALYDWAQDGVIVEIRSS